MAFTSYTFLVFVTVVFILLFLIPKRFLLFLLLFTSYLFYGYRDPFQCVALLTVTVACFVAARMIAAHYGQSVRKIILGVAILAIAGFLLVTKLVLVSGGGVIAPLGISFFALQGIAYCIDTYRKDAPQKERFDRVALFLSFFPYVQSGPIHRANEILPQFDRLGPLKSSDLFFGGKRILWGLFKKLVVADKLAMLVDPVFADPASHGGWHLLAVAYLYSIQLYADFSGYTDIAIGVGRLFGIRLSENFRNPYLATSLRDFWGRWHITLTSWFRDYVYIPLGGNRKGNIRWAGNVLLVFLLSGVWHGLGANFLAWGFIHGGLYLVGVSTIRLRLQIRKQLGFERPTYYSRVISIFFTFQLVAFAWIFFRAHSLSDATKIVEIISESFFELVESTSNLLAALQGLFNLTSLEFVGLAMTGIFLFIELTGIVQKHFLNSPEHRTSLAELALFNFCAIALLVLGDIGVREFIYFNF